LPANRSVFDGIAFAQIGLLRGRTRKEDTQMSVNTKAPTIPQVKQFAEERQASEATRFAQNFLLDEIPGLVFGLMTLAYIVSSLWSLI
jgi:hypothetical protein